MLNFCKVNSIDHVSGWSFITRKHRLAIRQFTVQNQQIEAGPPRKGKQRVKRAAAESWETETEIKNTLLKVEIHSSQNTPAKKTPQSSKTILETQAWRENTHRVTFDQHILHNDFVVGWIAQKSTHFQLILTFQLDWQLVHSTLILSHIQWGLFLCPQVITGTPFPVRRAAPLWGDKGSGCFVPNEQLHPEIPLCHRME